MLSIRAPYKHTKVAIRRSIDSNHFSFRRLCRKVANRDPRTPIITKIQQYRMASTGGSTSKARPHNLVWVDLEMTNLDLSVGRIVEMACIVTDGNLNILAEGPCVVIHQPPEVLHNMSEWCKVNFAESGLLDQIKQSTITTKQAEQLMIDFITPYIVPGQCPLAGNSIHMDKRFIDAEMPNFSKLLHYRLVDVSTIKELARRWYPKEFAEAPQKKGKHRALDDIKESIQELQYYQRTLFK